MARPLNDLLEKEIDWRWEYTHADTFRAIKDSLLHAPILALPNPEYPFSCLRCIQLCHRQRSVTKTDAAGRERVIAFESRQLKAAEKNYPVYDKELLAMKYALVRFRVHLLRSKPFVVYTGLVSLRTATQSPHLSQKRLGGFPSLRNITSR